MRTFNLKKWAIVGLAAVCIISLITAGYYNWKNKSFRFNNSQGSLPDNSENRSSSRSNQEVNIPDKFKIGTFSSPRRLLLPENNTISVFAAGMKTPRFFDFDIENNIFVTDLEAGKVLYIKDKDSDGIADETLTIDEKLRRPHGIDFYNNNLYVAEEDKVNVYKNLDSNGKFSSKVTLIKNLPAGQGHFTRTVIIGPDQKLYLAIGSSCNVCEEKDKRRASVIRYNLDGSGEEVFATGLRNSVGILFKGNELWSVDNGRDRIGDDLPPEEVNILQQNKNYGWPYCYGKGINNPEFPTKIDFCKKETVFPAFEMQAHSAPLGFNFVPDLPSIPIDHKNNMIIAFHGSWNRTEPTGYKVVTLDISDPNNKTVDFITGWLDEQGKVWGRPVETKFDSQGNLFISDDLSGAIYRVTFKD